MAPEKAWGFCPQCGGKVDLEVGDPLLRCAFCKTSLYIVPQSGIFSYILSPIDSATPLQGSRVFLPYWRFKGFRFRLFHDKSVKTSLVDSTIPALSGLDGLPSLGLATQLSDMRLDTGPLQLGRSFLAPQDAIRKVDMRIEAGLRESPVSSFILSEKITIISAPFELVERDEKLLLSPLWEKRRHFFKVKRNGPLESLVKKISLNDVDQGKGPASNMAVSFMPLICPECGTDLPALSMASVLFCKACKRLWGLGNSRFLPQKAHILTRNVERGMKFLPFYHFSLKLQGFPFPDRRAFLSHLYPYRQFPENFSKEPVQLVIPAFSVNPSLFIRLGKRMSSSQLPFLTLKSRDAATVPDAHCINIGVGTAIQSLTFLFMSLLKKRKKMVEAADKTKIRIKEIRLFFIPFKKERNELVEPLTGQAVPKAALHYGLNL